MTARLEVDGLASARGDRTVVRDVALSVAAGEIVALLGPNGAGKTSLLMTLAGLLPAQAGTVRVDGHELRPGRPASANRAGIVLMPDSRALFGSLSVADNLRVAARSDGPAPRDLLETFPGLEKRWDLRARALSGGEQQMLALARALIQQPRVLLVDELSLGLAPLVVESLFANIRAVTDAGCSVVVVEQHVNLVLHIADRVVVLNRGAVVLRDTADAVAADTGHLERVYMAVHTPGVE